jgi:hypothetical protein
MLCICRRPCQVRVSGRIVTFGLGDVIDFEECPMHFEALEGVKASPINFGTAEEAELLNSGFKLPDLRKYLWETYKKRTRSNDRERLISILLDCRYRELTVDPNKVI